MKTSRVNRATQMVVAANVCAYWRDPDRWPRSWMELEEDLPPGEALVDCLDRYADNLWAPSGEIIRDLNESSSPGKGRLGTVSRRCDPRVRGHDDPQRLGKRAPFLRLDLPKTPPLPQ